jgi:siroheme synthase (precorrin-2 oxidase/ferrochelatase)
MEEVLLCQRCFKPRDNEPWVFCIACAIENQKYRAKGYQQAKTMRHYTSKLIGSGKTGLSKSRKKADCGRALEILVNDEEAHHTEQNCRTDYHGDNYVDE